ncbi:MAG: restriction endonuclease subunit S [Deltaproteobacteria bacterium]|nr:restriction endonuclease subunit S [Deltaproteobacteria bacterium]
MREMKEMPKHWEVKKLGEVCDKITKGGTPTTYGFAFVSSGINFIKIENIEHGKVNLSSIRTFISADAHNYQKKSMLEENDLLFSIAGTIGETCLIKQEYLPANTNQALAILRGYYKKVQPQFLTYQLSSFISQYVKLKARGGAMNNISLEDLKGIDLVVPPLPEQQAIVAKIEELLSDLENGKQQLQTAQQQLKVYRQSLLKWAFEGKLTNKNVKEGELPKGWKSLKLKDITLEKEGLRRGPFGSAIKKEFFVPKGYKVYEQGNAINNDPYRGNYYLSEAKYQELIKFKVIPLDLIVSCSGVTLGRICEIPDDAKPGVINQALLRIRLKHNLILNKYFVLHFRGAFFQRKIFDQSQGTAMPNLVGIKDFKEIEMLIPPIEQQQKIIEELESKLTVCDKIEETISQSLQQAETLRQSILKKAFEGRLVNYESGNTNAN